MSQQLETPERPTIRPAIAGPTTAPPAPQPRRRKSNAELVHDGEDDGFFARHRVKVIAAGMVMLAVGAYFFLPKPGPSAPVRKVEKIITVQLPPPPKLLPPPPPKVEPPPEKMEKQAPVAEDKPKEAAPKKADNPPPTALATGIKGDGPGMGLASSGSGLGGGHSIGGKTGDGGGGGRWDRYAGQVQAKIADALRANPKTKAATISGLRIRIWPDAAGRITRAALAGSTGNAALDAAIQNEVLGGLQLAEPPPAGMKLPIVMRLSAKRP